VVIVAFVEVEVDVAVEEVDDEDDAVVAVFLSKAHVLFPWQV
jgi:hypothetical protein